MSMKTKGRCGKLPREAGISMKKWYLAARGGNVVENKGG
jgi:hypothetical protein